MLEVSWPRTVAIEWDGGTGKIQGASAEIRHHFDRIWVRDIDRCCRCHQCSHLGRRIFHDLQQASDVLRAGERLVALDVDVDVGWLTTGYFVHALRPTAVRGRSQLRLPTVFAADCHDFFSVSGDADLGE